MLPRSLNHIGPEFRTTRPRRRPASCAGRQRSSSKSCRTAARSHGRPSRCKRRAILPTTACPLPPWICHKNMAVLPSISTEALADRNRDNSAWTLRAFLRRQPRASEANPPQPRPIGNTCVPKLSPQPKHPAMPCRARGALWLRRMSFRQRLLTKSCAPERNTAKQNQISVRPPIGNTRRAAEILRMKIKPIIVLAVGPGIDKMGAPTKTPVGPEIKNDARKSTTMVRESKTKWPEIENKGRQDGFQGHRKSRTPPWGQDAVAPGNSGHWHGGGSI